MIAYCTYCSAEKDHSEISLPAISRYKSSRITKVYNSAITENVEFVILSGKYGIIDAHQNIDYYDHLLVPSEVDEHSELVTSQLKEMGITKLMFYAVSVLKDPNIQSYIDCIKLGAAKNGTAIEIREFS
ncbi:hypothetical protein OAE48_04355 [Flavobacteriales bacterium]|nr:hypothetical protein [Flavobacteriales bacterium]